MVGRDKKNRGLAVALVAFLLAGGPSSVCAVFAFVGSCCRGRSAVRWVACAAGVWWVTFFLAWPAAGEKNTPSLSKKKRNGRLLGAGGVQPCRPPGWRFFGLGAVWWWRFFWGWSVLGPPKAWPPPAPRCRPRLCPSFCGCLPPVLVLLWVPCGLLFSWSSAITPPCGGWGLHMAGIPCMWLWLFGL